MNVRTIISGLLVIVAFSFAQSADSTENSAKKQQVTISAASTKPETPKRLSKQKEIEENTTWSKIKDLFM